ncbi:hypothetical protein HYR54_09515 [Candidatus Acetothermia bacterium]|nr:hypothetical protein [Candidatus Acetothermia bacterium]MBI3459580.1 hypothetical protein [Candidatus Acetothermia bacterium]
MTRTIIANLFGQNSVQLASFVDISYSLSGFCNEPPDSAWQQAYVSGFETAEAQLEALLTEVTTFWSDEAVPAATTPAESLAVLFDRFHVVARQLRARHASRPTLNISDEYDVQDLLHALLRLYFDDVRTEEWTPSYAGSASRMDFILNEYGVVIEVKKTRYGMSAKDIGDQLLVDIMRYKTHLNAKQLFCFVYDPEGLLPNPTGIERDLSRISDELDVRCFIRPK